MAEATRCSERAGPFRRFYAANGWPQTSQTIATSQASVTQAQNALNTAQSALAADQAATENEARNAALIACRLIKEHDLLDAHAPDVEDEEPEPQVQREVRRAWYIRAKFPGRCSWCGDPIQEGQTIRWYGSGSKPDHQECGQRRQLHEGWVTP